MRTTLTIDDDVAAVLRRLVKSRKAKFKDIVNDALREGLQRLEGAAKRPTRYETQPVNLGRCLIGSLDCSSEALAVAEGEGFK